MKTNEKGQLTIFLGISMMIIITMLAFIINVGLFVKAKINLQNSVDAAAFSGAAVQARQLSNISYLNWEMRNTYKEWMFKYYVLGQISMSKINNVEGSPSNKYESQMTNSMLFRLNPFWRNTLANSGYYKPNIFDKYNIPSVCISFSQTHNICELYAIPGLPRFETNGLMGVSEHHEAFLNTIVQEKSDNCAKRTNLNFSVAMNWAYGTKNVIFQGTPEIASDRTGAWVQSIELAIRIRNLETLVNRAPIEVPICAVSDGSCRTIDDLDTSGGTMIPFNERPVKAFLSAYKNLGGDPSGGNDLKRSFKLTEIAPRVTDVSSKSLSGLLIPESVTIPGTTQNPTQKYYLDLRAMPLNLVTFFTSFTSATEANFGGGGTPSESSCVGSKTAIPVPGYIFGFTKNPEILTYYAVKGEANFVGLFYPFKGDGVKMAAYAAAKPFGGRIGPRLFDTSDNNIVTPITSATASQNRSLAYLSGVQIPPGTSYEPGELIPTQSTFWVQNGSSGAVGGIPDASIPQYAIPNLLYELEGASIGTIDNHASGSDTIQVLTPAASESDAMYARTTDKGLYKKAQFTQFFKNLGIPAGTIDFTPEVIGNAIEAVRAPTKYEALNYMIPSFDEAPDADPSNFDSIPIVYNMSGNTSKLVYELYGPIFGPGTLYENSASVQAAIYNYLYANEPSVNVYLNALQETHHSIMTDADSTEAGQASYRSAAESIWKPTNPDPTSGTAYNTQDPADCNSIAGRFRQFFLKDEVASGATCMIDSLSVSIAKYIDTEASAGSYSKYFRTTYKRPLAGKESLMTAYVPGPRTGASPEGEMINEFITLPVYTSKRNFYSTKFVDASRFFTNGNYIEAGVYKEVPGIGAVVNQPSFNNPIDANSLSEFGSLINH